MIAFSKKMVIRENEDKKSPGNVVKYYISRNETREKKLEKGSYSFLVYVEYNNNFQDLDQG